MTGRERLLTALRGGTPDRVPVWLWGVRPELPAQHPSIQPVVDAYLQRSDLLVWWHAGGSVFLSDAEVPAHVETRPSPLPDYNEHISTWQTPAGELTQVMYTSPAGRPGYVHKHMLETPEDVRRFLSVEYIPPRPDCSSFFALDASLGARGMLVAHFSSDPMYALNRLTGSEGFALWSIDERAMLDELIGILLERTLDYVGWLISQGVGQALGYVGPELCIPPLQSPADFERWVVGPDRQIADLIHDAGGLMLVHCHGGLDPILEGFVRMGADALHPIEPPAPDGSGLQGGVTMADAKRRVGEDLCIIGNIQHHEIEVAPHAYFREMVAETVRVGMEGGGFILSPTATLGGWPTMTDHARENWLAMLDVALEVGQYV